MRGLGGGHGVPGLGRWRGAADVGPCPMAGGSPVFEPGYLPRVHSPGPWDACPCCCLALALELRGGPPAAVTPGDAMFGRQSRESREDELRIGWQRAGATTVDGAALAVAAATGRPCPAAVRPEHAAVASPHHAPALAGAPSAVGQSPPGPPEGHGAPPADVWARGESHVRTHIGVGVGVGALGAGRHLAQQPMGLEDTPAADLGYQRVAGARPVAAFPQRQAVYVLGRPVVVPPHLWRSLAAASARTPCPVTGCPPPPRAGQWGVCAGVT